MYIKKTYKSRTFLPKEMKVSETNKPCSGQEAICLADEMTHLVCKADSELNDPLKSLQQNH